MITVAIGAFNMYHDFLSASNSRASRSNHIKPQRRSARSEKNCFSDGLCVLDVIFLERLSLSEYWDGWLYGLLDHRPKTTCFFQEFIAFLT
jgi:hypothetical protein